MHEATPLSRHENEILQTVRSRGSCTIMELASLLSVSDETVRRHVQPLVKKGLVHRVHGGVVLPEQEAPFRRRLGENQQAKQLIASSAASLINNGDSLFIDSGTTTNYVAMALGSHRNLSIVTNSVEIARILATRNNNSVYIAGGELRSDDAASFGKAAVDFIQQFDVRHTILSIGAMNANGVFFNFHLEEAQISQAGIACAEQVVMVADHSKYSRKGLVKVCDLHDVDILVSDKAPPKSLSKTAVQTKTRILVAK